MSEESGEGKRVDTEESARLVGEIVQADKFYIAGNAGEFVVE